MPERTYPISEEELLRRRILTPQPSRAPYSPSIDLINTTPVPAPEPAKIPGYVFAKSCQLPNGIISYNNPTGYVPLELVKEYGELEVYRASDGSHLGAFSHVTGQRLKKMKKKRNIKKYL